MKAWLRRVLLLALVALAIGGVQAGIVAGGSWWARSRAVSAGTPVELGSGRALCAAALFLGPWTPFAAALACAGWTLRTRSVGRGTRDGSTASPEGLPAGFGEAAETALLALAVAAGGILGIAALRRAWGVPSGTPPDPGHAMVYLGSLAIAAAGLFAFARRFASPEGSFLAVSGLVALLTGSVFFADGWIERSPPDERAGRIELAIGANPLLAGAGEVAGVDVLRSRGFYGASVIGPYYPYRYPETRRSRDRHLAVALAGFGGALAVAGLRSLARRVLPRRQ